MRLPFLRATLTVFLAIGCQAKASEPNDTFGTATVLSPGVLYVSEELTLDDANFDYPDTLLRAVDENGQTIGLDDDGAPLDFGDGRASALFDLPFDPTVGGQINIDISAYPDGNFVGSHSDQGYVEALYEVFDSNGELVDEFSDVGFLEQGSTLSFVHFDNAWAGGYYNVILENTAGFYYRGDIDFFTFTGLTPNAGFAAEILDPAFSGVDTVMALFDDTGAPIEYDDDDGAGVLSKIEGVVPVSGKLHFAVAGYSEPDEYHTYPGFVHKHSEEGQYDLKLSLTAPGLSGDYNHDNVVDAADYAVWRNTLGEMGSGLPADADQSGEVDQADYDAWRSHYGEMPTQQPANIAAPEPTAVALALLGVAWAVRARHPTAAT